MPFQHLTVENDGHIVRCRIANPPRHTLVFQGVRELHHLLNELEEHPEVRVLILTGASEDFFIRHYEVEELADVADENIASGNEAPTEMPSKLHAFNQLCLRLERAPYIVIAALNGSAAGGGCEVALSCDFRLMSKGADHFGLPETNIGIIPGGGGTQRFARLLGTAKALDLILHGRVLSPDDALELGLVHRLYPAITFEAAVTDFAENLASRAPEALRQAKRAIRQGVDQPIEQGLALEQVAFDQTMFTGHAARAMRAYLSADVMLGDMDYDFSDDD